MHAQIALLKGAQPESAVRAAAGTSSLQAGAGEGTAALPAMQVRVCASHAAFLAACGTLCIHAWQCECNHHARTCDMWQGTAAALDAAAPAAPQGAAPAASSPEGGRATVDVMGPGRQVPASAASTPAAQAAVSELVRPSSWLTLSFLPRSVCPLQMLHALLLALLLLYHASIRVWKVSDSAWHSDHVSAD